MGDKVLSNNYSRISLTYIVCKLMVTIRQRSATFLVREQRKLLGVAFGQECQREPKSECIKIL